MGAFDDSVETNKTLYNDDIICGASPALAKYMLESQAVPQECGNRPRPALGGDLAARLSLIDQFSSYSAHDFCLHLERDKHTPYQIQWLPTCDTPLNPSTAGHSLLDSLVYDR
jgi:hypothetical protein